MSLTGSGQAITAQLNEALHHYHEDDALACLTGLTRLHLVQAQARRHPALGVDAALRAILDQSLNELIKRDRLLADVLVRRFVQHKTVTEVAEEFNFSVRTIYSRQDEAIDRLTIVLLEMEDQILAAQGENEDVNCILDTLPPPTFTRLFGTDDILATLKSFLVDRVHGWLISVEGMGGSGKTALARQAVEDLVKERHFKRALWITARQQNFDEGRLRIIPLPALTYTGLLEQLADRLHLPQSTRRIEDERSQTLRKALRDVPTILVVDNLESATTINGLVTGLQTLARPTKILLTTRQSMAENTSVTALALPSLTTESAQAFIRHHAQTRHVRALADAPQRDVAEIAALCDGNPLAITLVVGQLHTLPLRQVLTDLQQARGRSADLLRFLFHYSWEQLSPTARQLLQHMPLLDIQGVAWQELAAVSNVVPDGEFCRALEELLGASLMYAGYSQGQVLYSTAILNLTRGKPFW
ncbi:MAG: hypothetical protein KBG20_18625 [Caldilineaceae bacterium]|nr:hypothetical protein [Caldilineaceae bacterium]MBP8125041.1 hypothetical protein [Caldilineaceae bacterium]MBP9074329.1 hypothetical protein [Caldilineaceae bacterium]